MTFPRLDPRYPHAQRVLRARQLILAQRYQRLQFWLQCIDEMVRVAVEFDKQLEADSWQLLDDAERVHRARKKNGACKVVRKGV